MSVEQLKEEVNIVDLLEYLGADVGAGGSWNTWQAIRCPFHNDTVASASVNRQTGKFNCHGCDVGGDIIDLAKEELVTADFQFAREWLERTFT